MDARQIYICKPPQKFFFVKISPLYMTVGEYTNMESDFADRTHKKFQCKFARFWHIFFTQNLVIICTRILKLRWISAFDARGIKQMQKQYRLWNWFPWNQTNSTPWPRAFKLNGYRPLKVTWTPVHFPSFIVCQTITIVVSPSEEKRYRAILMTVSEDTDSGVDLS